MTPATIMLALLAAVLISVPWIVVVDRLVRSHDAMHDDLTDVESHLDELTKLLFDHFDSVRPDNPRQYRLARQAVAQLGGQEKHVA